MEAGIKVGLHNKFDIEVRDAKTNELKQSATAYNIVLNQLWTRVLARNAFMSAIHVGTGTGTLSPSRTSLFTFLFGRNVTLDGISFNINNMYRRVKIQIQPSEYVGQTFTEVGVAYGTSSGNLCTHAMLTDAEGNPISILKTDTDVVIIYATVFFTVSELPEHVKLSGIFFGNDISGNQTLAMLINQSGSIETNIRVGTYGDKLADTIWDKLRGLELATKTATLTTDAGNKKIVFPTRRFEIAEANGPIQEFNIGGSFNIQLPNDDYTGTQYTDVILTGQDGAKVYFMLPSINVDAETIVVKVNNVVTEDLEIIPMPYYRTYRPSSNKTDELFFQSNSKFFYTYGDSTPRIYGVEWDGTQWKQTISLSGLPGTSSYFGMFYESSLAYAYRYSNEKVRIYSKDNVKKAEYTGSSIVVGTSIDVSGFLSDNVVLISLNTSSSSSKYTFVMGYTLDEGETWSWTGYLVSTFSSTYSPLVVPARTKQIFFQGADASNAFRLYSYNLEARTITLMSVPTATNRALGCFSMDESLLVAYGSSDGLDVFEEVEGVWTKTNVIPDTISPATYNMAWFVGDFFIAGNTSTNLYSVWQLVEGSWVKVLINVPTAQIFDDSVSGGRYLGSYLHTYNRKSQDGMHMSAPSNNIYRCTFDSSYMIKFDTPPAAEDEIKVSYKVNGIHKTTNYVLDVGGYIQFGEG